MATEENLERLQQKHSVAQTAFTKRANHLTSTANALGQHNMKDEWRNFKMEHFKVRETWFEYAMALSEVESETAEEKAVQIEENTAECDHDI